MRSMILCVMMLYLFAVSDAAIAQERTPPPGAPRDTNAGPRQAIQQKGTIGNTQPASNRPAGRRLPADAVTKHNLNLPSGALAFAATAGTIELENAQGAVDAEIAYISYTLDGVAPATRPVTFAVNGGPGASSAWLQLGIMGPWRLAVDGQASLSAPVALADNPDTWLQFTDLVFIDPIGAGFSRRIAEQPAQRTAPGEGGGDGPPGPGARAAQNPYWTVDGDIRSLTDFIDRWLQKSGRFASPKFVIGESYGGFRGPKLVHQLQTGKGVGINGLMLVSPVLDFSWLGEGGRNPVFWTTRLPSYAATARASKGPVKLQDLDDVESYAKGEYLTDLMRGDRDIAAVQRRADRVAVLTGLDPALVLKLGGRIPSDIFRRERGRQNGLVASAYDATDNVLDPYPESSSNRADSGLGPLLAPFTTAMQILYGSRLNWHAEGPYRVLNNDVARAWSYGPGGRLGQEAVSDLRESLALDPKLRVLVSHGLFDLVTPYFQSRLLLDQLPLTVGAERVNLTAYPGGHMFYLNDASRAAFREDAQSLYKAALENRRS